MSDTTAAVCVDCRSTVEPSTGALCGPCYEGRAKHGQTTPYIWKMRAYASRLTRGSTPFVLMDDDADSEGGEAD